MEDYKIDVALSLLMVINLLEYSKMEDQMEKEKCIIRIHYYQLRME